MAKRRKKKNRSAIQKQILIIAIAAIFGSILTVFSIDPIKDAFWPTPIEHKDQGRVDRKEPLPPHPSPTPIRARAAIVIDDMGGGVKTLRRILEIEPPINIAILPYLQYSKKVAKEAKEHGVDVLLHLPMEPIDISKYNPGKGVLLTSMSDAEIKAHVENSLDAVPYLMGVNNHMGSKFTADERSIKIAMEVVKNRGNLYFLDSRTTANSKAYKVAKDMGLHAAKRNIFLDNNRDVAYIRDRITELIDLSIRNGTGIAIGHPYPETIQAIEEMLPRFKEEGIEIVNLSELVN